jgi:hypothetical protein
LVMPDDFAIGTSSDISSKPPGRQAREFISGGFDHAAGKATPAILRQNLLNHNFTRSLER